MICETRSLWLIRGIFMLLKIPKTQCAATPSTDDQALKDKRARIREALQKQQVVKVSPVTQGLTTDPSDPGIEVPPGKLASSFYWYENDRGLYDAEVNAMRRFFPKFKLNKESDGRLSWIGPVTPGLLDKQPRTYTLQAVYDHNHPSNSTYGGSIKVYSVDPDLAELAAGDTIPHTLRDSEGELYICTARMEDVHVGKTVTTAASALSWAVKWLSVFEIWLSGDITEQDFASHTF